MADVDVARLWTLLAEARDLIDGEPVYCQRGVVIASECDAVRVGDPCPHCEWLKKAEALNLPARRP